MKVKKRICLNLTSWSASEDETVSLWFSIVRNFKLKITTNKSLAGPAKYFRIRVSKAQKLRSVASIVESVRKQRAILKQTFLKLPLAQWIQCGDNVTRLANLVVRHAAPAATPWPAQQVCLRHWLDKLAFSRRWFRAQKVWSSYYTCAMYLIWVVLAQTELFYLLLVDFVHGNSTRRRVLCQQAKLLWSMKCCFPVQMVIRFL